jgi:hypothetical protein
MKSEARRISTADGGRLPVVIDTVDVIEIDRGRRQSSIDAVLRACRDEGLELAVDSDGRVTEVHRV